MYDTNCYKLAEMFLSDESADVNTEANRDRLAQVIQNAIEGEIDSFNADADAAAQPVVPDGTAAARQSDR